jgi:type VI secretion system protein ImpE
MTASDLFKAGKLADAIEAQIQAVKNQPADHGKRLFLFELSAFAGDFDRARRQIDVLKFEEVELQAAARQYRGLLDSEEARRKLFADGIEPKFLAAVPEHTAWRLEAVQAIRSQQPADAAALLARADQARPALKGKLNGKPFSVLRDCDDLFGDVMEVMANGNYFWVPLEQVESITLTPPKFPRDLLWRAARLETHDSAGEVFLPSLYPGSHASSDEQIQLGKRTDWIGGDTAPTRGLGAHLYLVDEDAVSLLEWTELQLDAPTAR